MLISEEYRTLNKKLHRKNPTYGRSILGTRFAPHIAELAKSLDANSILDYGCGKGEMSKALSHFLVIGYDPAIEGKDDPPEPHDMVICLDVLEHIEPECLDDVLDDLKRCALKGIFLNVACRPAGKTLADGRNAHLIQEPPEWWLPKLMERFEIRVFNAKAGEFCVFALSKEEIKEVTEAA